MINGPKHIILFLFSAEEAAQTSSLGPPKKVAKRNATVLEADLDPRPSNRRELNSFFDFS